MAFPFHAFALRSFPSFSFSKLPCHSFGKHSLIFQRWNDLNLSSLTYKASILEEFLKVSGADKVWVRADKLPIAMLIDVSVIWLPQEISDNVFLVVILDPLKGQRTYGKFLENALIPKFCMNE
ncbi:hypothetical protein DITRI_Ditri14bG0128900 [Diplodiscus trichospermus]